MYEQIIQALIKSNWVVTLDIDDALDMLNLDFKTVYENQELRDMFDKACDEVFEAYRMECLSA